MLKRKRVLISGATGFIGANLVRKCLEAEAHVHIITRITSNKWRIRDVLEDVNEYCVDLLDYKKLKAIVFKVRPEIILHTAIYGSYPFQKDVNKIIQTNIIGTSNLINACSEVGFNFFVNTGSSSEYGIKDAPMNETDLLEPINIYGATKAAATLICQTKSKSEKLPIVTLRLFSPYGYYEEPTRLIPSVILACLRKENPRLLSPECVRDFIFIEDVVDASLMAIETPNSVGEVFNIACGKQVLIKEVFDEIFKLTGNDVQPLLGNIPKQPHEPNIWQANIAKAGDILNWSPKYSLHEGLSKTIQWFKENLSLYDKTPVR